MYKTNYSTKKPTYNFDKKYFFIYYQLVNESNKIRIINSFGDTPTKMMVHTWIISDARKNTLVVG